MPCGIVFIRIVVIGFSNFHEVVEEEEAANGARRHIGRKNTKSAKAEVTDSIGLPTLKKGIKLTSPLSGCGN